MDNNQQPNTGSFMAPAGGGGSAIAQAMTRRGLGGGALNQVGPSAPTFPNAAQLPSVPGSQPTPGSVPPPPAVAPPAMGSAPLPPASAEAQTILKALSKRLSDLTDMQKGGIQ